MNLRFWPAFGLFITIFLAQSGVWAQNIEDLPLHDPSVPTLKVPPLEHPHRDDEPVHFDFMRQALYAGLLVGALCGYLGLFVVARRMVFISVALAEMSSAGIALGLLLGFSPLWGALGFMVLGVALFSRRWTARRLPEDAPIGVFYVAAIALGILLIAKSAMGETHMLKLLQGDVLASDPRETLEMAAAFAVLALLHILFAKEFLLVSLDRDMAATLGFRAQAWDFLLFLTIGLAVSLAIRSTGVLMTTTLFIIPATTALLLAQRWKWAVIAAPCLAMAAVTLGLKLSLRYDFPASAVIVAVSFALLAPVYAWNGLARKI